MAFTRTTLTTAISGTDLIMTLASVTGLTNGMYCMLGNELVQVTGTPDTTALTAPITRGAASTAVTPHPAGLLVMFAPAAQFTNVGGFNNAVNGNSANFNTLLSQQMRIVTGAATATLKAGEVANGLLDFDGTGGITLTTPTAALLLAAFPGQLLGGSVIFLLKNTGTGTITVAAGSGCTIVGTATVATLNAKLWLIHWTSTVPGAETYTLRSIMTGVF